MITTKSCRRCGLTKLVSAFPRSDFYPDGYRTRCRDCYNADGREVKAELKARHVCVDCKHARSTRGIRCDNCADKHAARERARRARLRDLAGH